MNSWDKIIMLQKSSHEEETCYSLKVGEDDNVHIELKNITFEYLCDLLPELIRFVLTTDATYGYIHIYSDYTHPLHLAAKIDSAVKIIANNSSIDKGKNLFVSNLRSIHCPALQTLIADLQEKINISVE